MTQAGSERLVLYKYRFIDPAFPERSSRIFTHNELYFPHARQFNDPFDCRFSFSFASTSAQLRDYLRRNVRRRLPHLNRHEREAWVAEKIRLQVHESSGFKAGLTEAIEKMLMTEVGIYSLSRIHDDILMWSHYAASHRGYCLIFAEAERFFARAQEVVYSDIYPIINPVVEDDRSRWTKTLLTKATHWKYEEELRIIEHETGPGRKYFPAAALLGVIFGCKMEKADKARVMEWCEGRNPPIEYFEAVQSENTYSLNIVPFGR